MFRRIRFVLLVLLGALHIPMDGAIRLVVTEIESDPPLPCRIHLKDSQGKPVQPPGLPFWRDHFVSGGDVSLSLMPGNYTFEIERGPEYKSVAGGITVTASDPNPAITNHLVRLADLSKEGWWSGELHVHRPLADIELLMRAEDLHVAPVITWWNNMNVWKDRARPARNLVRFDGSRLYHAMGGEDERNGGALLFFNLEAPLEITGAKREYPSPMKFLNEARQHPGAWIDVEKPFWYDVPTWLASGKIDSIGIANNHMYRSGMYPNEAWGKPRDLKQFPDPTGNGDWTQEIYYHALNCGFRLPPSAGSASGVLPNPVGYNRAYVHLEGELTYEKWWQGLRAGRVFVSNGPLLRCRANGKFPGEVFIAPKGGKMTCRIETALDSRDPVRPLEIIKNGRIERTVQPGSGPVEIDFTESGWFLVRAKADLPNTYRFASTGPFYVEVGAGSTRISKSSAQFFLDWERERIGKINLENAEERAEVLKPHHESEKFWQEKVRRANVE